MKTTINWRPYPEQKPPKSGWYTIMAKGHLWGRVSNKALVGRECYRDKPADGYSEGWAQDHNLSSTRGIEVTHFALPKDITTEET